MNNKKLKFCKAFVKSFDFEYACEQSKSRKSTMLADIYDEQSEVRQYIDEELDILSLQSSFITDNMIKYRLGKIILSEEPQHQIAAAKILLSFESEKDGSEAFKALLKALTVTNTE